MKSSMRARKSALEFTASYLAHAVFIFLTRVKPTVEWRQYWYRRPETHLVRFFLYSHEALRAPFIDRAGFDLIYETTARRRPLWYRIYGTTLSRQGEVKSTVFHAALMVGDSCTTRHSVHDLALRESFFSCFLSTFTSSG